MRFAVHGPGNPVASPRSHGVPRRDIPGRVHISIAGVTAGLPRSVGPAGLITGTAGDLLTFARLHLDGGVTADGKRLLSEASVTAMQSACAAIPEFSAPGSTIGLG